MIRLRDAGNRENRCDNVTHSGKVPMRVEPLWISPRVLSQRDAETVIIIIQNCINNITF